MRRTPALIAVLVIGVVEFLGLLGYAMTIVLSSLLHGTSGATGSDVSPWVLLVTYCAFAALVGLIWRGLWRGSAAARTPFLLAQAFAIVIAQPLTSGGEVFERGLGWGLVLIALAGAGLILSRQASSALR